MAGNEALHRCGRGVNRRVNRRRFLAGAAMALHAGGSLNLRPLVTHVFSMEDADKAYKLLHQNPGEAVQVVLEF